MTLKKLTLDNLLHRLWSKAVGTPNYIKSEWMELESRINKLDKSSPFPLNQVMQTPMPKLQSTTSREEWLRNHPHTAGSPAYCNVTATYCADEVQSTCEHCGPIPEEKQNDKLINQVMQTPMPKLPTKCPVCRHDDISLKNGHIYCSLCHDIGLYCQSCGSTDVQEFIDYKNTETIHECRCNSCGVIAIVPSNS